MKNPNIFNTREIGEVSEIAFSLQAISEGLYVSKPVFSGLPYDLIVDNQGALFRVQVKSSRKIANGKHYINVSYGRKQKRIYTEKNIDIFAVHITLLDIWYIVPVGAINGKKNIRIDTDSLDDEFQRYRECWEIFNPKSIRVVASDAPNQKARTRGNIHTDQKCPVCGRNLIYNPERHGCFCPEHPGQAATKFRVRYKKKFQRRTQSIEYAERLLHELRMKNE